MQSSSNEVLQKDFLQALKSVQPSINRSHVTEFPPGEFSRMLNEVFSLRTVPMTDSKSWRLITEAYWRYESPLHEALTVSRRMKPCQQLCCPQGQLSSIRYELLNCSALGCYWRSTGSEEEALSGSGVAFEA